MNQVHEEFLNLMENETPVLTGKEKLHWSGELHMYLRFKSRISTNVYSLKIYNIIKIKGRKSFIYEGEKFYITTQSYDITDTLKNLIKNLIEENSNDIKLRISKSRTRFNEWWNPDKFDWKNIDHLSW